MYTFFIHIYSFIKKYKVYAVIASLLLFIGLSFLVTKINFEEDITRVLPKNEKTDVTAKVLQQIDFSDKITVILERGKEGSFEEMTQLATNFIDSLHTCNQYIKEVQGQFDEENILETTTFVYENLPLFLEDQDYSVIEKKLAKDSIALQVEKNYKTLISPTGIISRDFILRDPLGISFIGLKKLQSLTLEEDFTLENGFIVTKDKSKLLIFISPKNPSTETDKNTNFVAQLNDIKERLNVQYKNKVTIDYLGATFVAVANAKQIKQDIQTTVVFSMGVLMLLLIFFYRKIYIPIIVFIPTIFGALVGAAALLFVQNSISAISVSIGAILLGVTIDYSLHILTHCRQTTSVEALYKDITMPIVMSSATTAISFLCLLFVQSEVLNHLGVFAATSVFFAAIFALILIPHLYKPNTNIVVKLSFLDKIAAYDFHKNKILIVISLILIVVSFFLFNKVQFNNDLSDLNYVPTDIKQAEAKLENTTNHRSKSIYLVIHSNDEQEAINSNNQLFKTLSEDKAKGSIIDYSSVGNIVLSKAEQNKRIAKWRSFWNSKLKSKVKQDLIVSGEVYGFKPETHRDFYDLIDQDFAYVSQSAYDGQSALSTNDFIKDKQGFYTISTIVKVDGSKREQFISEIEKKNKNIIVIDRKQMNETFLGKLKQDFGSLINYSLIAVFLILLIFFRRVELAILAITPILITGVLTAGAIAFFSIQLNIFSTIVCTLIFGIGVDFSIFMTSALQKEYTYGKGDLATYRTSILLAVITTVLAVGTMIFAKHPALQSIASVSLIGILSSVVITFVFYPLLFKVVVSNRPINGKSPITLRLLIHSTASFIYYGLSGIIFSILGRTIISLIPTSSRVKNLWYRKIISSFMKSVLYSNPFVKKQILNKNQETFNKPSVIISNHTSFLDTLAIGMVTPKIIYLVNDWVYNSPIFGGIVRYAGYYPVSKGVEGSVEYLREKVEQGYSLMIFPEGSRSDDNSIKRFHKGAFYLAEQLQLDVLPIYIHGNAETLPKGDHIIYDESISVIVGDRISANDSNFGENYSERTKKINQYFREQFTAIRKEYEGENYFYNKLILSYLYKQGDVVSNVKTDFKTHKKRYFELNKRIDQKAKILRFGNDFGQIDILLTLQEPQRSLHTYIENDEKKSAAINNYLVKKRKINYNINIDDACNVVDTLLITSEIDTKLIEKINLENIKTIIIFEEARFEFKNQHFDKIAKEWGFEVYKKRICE